MTDTYLFLLAQQPMYNGGGGPGSRGWGMMMYSPFGGWFMILLLAVAVAVVVMIFRGSRGSSSGNAPGSGFAGHAETPLDILKRRYAAGEIDKKQFEEMKRDLSE